MYMITADLISYSLSMYTNNYNGNHKTFLSSQVSSASLNIKLKPAHFIQSCIIKCIQSY